MIYFYVPALLIFLYLLVVPFIESNPTPASSTGVGQTTSTPAGLISYPYPDDIWYTIPERFPAQHKLAIRRTAADLNQYLVRKLLYCRKPPCGSDTNVPIEETNQLECFTRRLGYQPRYRFPRIYLHLEHCFRLDQFRVVGPVKHEMLHLHGLVNEHQRPDRDDCLTINWKFIAESDKSSYEIKVGKFFNQNGPIDGNSLMMYDPNISTRTAKASIEFKPECVQDPLTHNFHARSGLWNWDYIKVNKAYPALRITDECQGPDGIYLTGQVIEETRARPCTTPGEELIGSLERLCLCNGAISGHDPICVSRTPNLLYCNFEDGYNCDMFQKKDPLDQLNNPTIDQPSWQVLEAFEVKEPNLIGDFTYSRLSGKVIALRLSTERPRTIYERILMQPLLQTRWMPISSRGSTAPTKFCIEFGSFLSYDPNHRLTLSVGAKVRRRANISVESYRTIDASSSIGKWAFSSFTITYRNVSPPDLEVFDVSFNFEVYYDHPDTELDPSHPDISYAVLDNVRIHQNGLCRDSAADLVYDLPSF